jgi:UDP-N-acetylmuramate--alanine ligase
MIKVGIFFGGSSREREVSFAGGRTVYDNLDKNLFEAVPIFVDSFNNFILLNWEFIYKGSIRDFYPTVSALKDQQKPLQIYAESLPDAHRDNGRKMAAQLGKIIKPEELNQYMDFAFLALHGMYGEDGTIQGLLEWFDIPYTGSGIMPSAIGMHKKTQKTMLQHAGFNSPKFLGITKQTWQTADRKKLLADVKKQVGLPFVIKPANQGSSVGVSVITENNIADFEKAVDASFFIQTLEKNQWVGKSEPDKLALLQKMADVKEGISFPVLANGSIVYNPDELYVFLDHYFAKKLTLKIESVYSETECLIEGFIKGREFSCIVIKDENGKAIALPPTEIVKGTEVYDYRSKYLPGLSRKVTPIDIAEKQVQNIRKECVRLFEFFKFNTYARIDGFITVKNEIFLNDPNTTSGMMPSSFFFHQAAEIGLNPSQFLTFIIRTSLAERVANSPVHFHYQQLLHALDNAINANKKQQQQKKRVAVFMGGYSTERHISVESGRNIYEKLASSSKYQPFPVFVTGDDKAHTLHVIPINVMLKDNADDIREKVFHFKRAAVVEKIILECKSIIDKYGNAQNLFEPKQITYKQLAKMADAVFIALHGRPGEDGTVQKELNKLRIPYNGSGVESSQITINKFETNKLLRAKGFNVAEHMLVFDTDWKKDSKKVIAAIEKIGYPLIAKPADDGCSSAVKKIKTRAELVNYAEGVFRNTLAITPALANKLGLKPKEEFPKKNYFLVEGFIDRNNAAHFLEITGGMLTSYDAKGKLVYESFEPSEALAEGEILSLEEKFLAGQGQNITPARYHKNEKSRLAISKQVQQVLVEGAKVLNVQGYCRIDAFVRIDKKNKPEVVFIEVNSLPGMTPATAIFHQCALNGYKPYEFIDAILEFGAARTAKGF